VTENVAFNQYGGKEENKKECDACALESVNEDNADNEENMMDARNLLSDDDDFHDVSNGKGKMLDQRKMIPVADKCNIINLFLDRNSDSDSGNDNNKDEIMMTLMWAMKATLI